MNKLALVASASPRPRLAWSQFVWARVIRVHMVAIASPVITAWPAGILSNVTTSEPNTWKTAVFCCSGHIGPCTPCHHPVCYQQW